MKGDMFEQAVEHIRPFTSRATKGERKARLFLSGFEATIACMKCEKAFASTDRRRVRHCDQCRGKLADIEETLGIGGELAP